VVGRGEGEEDGREVMRRAALAFAALLAASSLASAEPRHGLSAFGELKYPADFKHFDYVNPDAQKAGSIATIGTLALQTFDSFNGYILKGDPAQGIGFVFDSLMVRAFDEPDAVYGLIAESADVAADKMSVVFALRKEAKFADSSPVTSADVCASFDHLKKDGHPNIQTAIKDIKACEMPSPLSVRYVFEGGNTRDLPMEIAVRPVFSKAYYEKNEFAKTSFDPPLGSGPYKVGRFVQGQYVTYDRREDYWAKDLPVNRGRFNFDTIRYEYFRDRTPEVEAIKSGQLDLREEFTSRAWANDYEGLNSVAEKRLLRDTLPDGSPSGAQGYFFNMRRAQFADKRVRVALGMAFDFEWTNANLFYGLYKRSASVFENSPLKAEGEPSPEELALLEPMRGELPPDVFGPAIMPPVSDGSGKDRKLFRAASKLLDEAGWKLDGTLRKNAKGETLKAELLTDSPSLERIINPFIENLKLIGVDASLRIVDEAQHQRRVEDFDYDISFARFVLDQTPGSSFKALFGSDTADQKGSYNLSGMKSPAVDKLIDIMAQAKSRKELETAARALDRALRAEYFWVPNWYKGSHWVAWWDQYGRPPVKPAYDRAILDTWWFDAAKAAKLKRGN
jgi:microcin C transport system substrate-binding protein